MRFHELRDCILNKINIKKRLCNVFIAYILSLMVSTRKHTITYASELSKIGMGSLSKFLKNNLGISAYTLENLSKKEAKRFSKVLETIDSLPWKIFIVIDATILKRTSLKSINVQRFNHGQGFVIGHQWTNIILIINGMIIPLKPIPFYSKKYCRKMKIKYKTEHVRVVEFMDNLNLFEYVGYHNNDDVLVLTDSGYDDKKIQNKVIEKGWHFVGALKSSRSVKSAEKNGAKTKSSVWEGIEAFFKKNRRIKWETIRIFTDGAKSKRKDFRVRCTEVFLRDVGKIKAVCSEYKKGCGGCRKYLACSDLKANSLEIVKAYRLRWKIEIFHKEVKMFLGFEDIAAKHFTSVETHVYLVYCAYILLKSDILGDSKNKKTVKERQEEVMRIIEKKEIASTIQELTKIKGVDKVKRKLKSALAA